MCNDNGFEAEITLSNAYTMSDHLHAVPSVISRKSFQTTQHPVRPKIPEIANMDGSPFDFSGRSLAFSKDVCASVDMDTQRCHGGLVPGSIRPKITFEFESVGHE